jgi:hypothetical protein
MVRTVQASALVVLALAAGCSRRSDPTGAVAEQLTDFPITIQGPEPDARLVLVPVRAGLVLTASADDPDRYQVRGRWSGSGSLPLDRVPLDVLREAMGRAGILPDSIAIVKSEVELTGTMTLQPAGSTWRIARRIPPWSREASRTHRPAVPLRLDRWRRIVVDQNRPGKAVFVIPGDIDHDGRPEILAGAFAYHRRGAGDDRWSRSRLGGDLGNVALAGDFDGDGYLDLIGTKSDDDYPVDSTIAWLRGTADGALVPGTAVPHGHGDFLQGVALVSQAGHSAQVAFSWHQGKNGIQLLSLTDGKPDSLVTISAFSQDEQLTAADIDRDGRVDLVTGTRWLRHTDSAWVLETIDTTSDPPDRNRVGDINGDGLPDVVTGFEAISRPGWLVWYEQLPGGGWRRHDIAKVTGPMSLDLGDLDGDGDIDIVAGEHNLKEPGEARLLLFENLGAGASWRQIEVAKGDEHHDGAQLVDIDGDGDPDIISVGWGHSKVLLYENLAIP